MSEIRELIEPAEADREIKNMVAHCDDQAARYMTIVVPVGKYIRVLRPALLRALQSEEPR